MLTLLVAMFGVPLLAFSQVPERVSVALSELTVPASGLPDGCALKSSDELQPFTIISSEQDRQVLSSRQRIQPPGVTENPWIGSDGRVLLYLAERLAVNKTVVDAPRTREEYVRFFTTGVREGYSAAYSMLDEPLVVVRALRVDSPPDYHVRGRLLLITPDVVASVRGGPGDCFDAVVAHVNLLASADGVVSWPIASMPARTGR